MGSKIKRIGLYVMAILYIFAGVNHFVSPESYLKIMPPYFPNQELLNYLAGIAEIVLGAGLFFSGTRKWAAFGIILMLIAFIPVHTYFIQVDSCIPDGICLPSWTGWFRLVIIHPILLLWAYIYTYKT